MSLPLVEPVIGELINLALTELLGVVKIIASSKTWGKELEEKLSSVKPAIVKLSRHISDTLPDRDNQFKDFEVVLEEGITLVDRIEKVHSFDTYRKYRYGKKIQKFQRKVYDFLLTQVPLNTALDVQVPLNTALDVQKLDADFMVYFQRFESEIKSDIAGMANEIKSDIAGMANEINTTQVSQTSSNMMHETTTAHQAINCTSQIPDMPKFVVGLDNRIKDVKQILLQNDVNVVGIAGMGGSGKSTLAAALCRDTDVKDHFQEKNIIFITVSLLDNVNGPLEILEVMWHKLIDGQMPKFRSIEDARNQLNEQLKSRRYRPTLLVLDDVRFTANLESLLFEAKGYKTIITTRRNDIIPIRDNTRQLYKMKMLEEANALPLFCFWAFGQTSIPTTANQNLVRQVAAKCNGLPLALKVIGSSLCQAPRTVWESANEKLSRAQPISDLQRDELLRCLETSVDLLDEESKQCFLDLGAFPKGRKFSVDLLLDIWVYVRGMEWKDAFVFLLELASRNLLNITSDPGSRAISFGCASELSFSQHDVMRDLALRLANHDNTIHCKRLFMPSKEDSIPTKWLTLKDQTSQAQFVSIHTGQMEEQNWCQINFPEVEALALFFAATQYCLPTFLHTMPKLKVVIIYNYGSKRATVHRLSNFPTFTHLKSVLVERLIVSSPFEYCRFSGNLEKLSVCLCEGLGNMTLLDKEQVPKFPMFREIIFDHCSDLEELPGKICNLTSLQKLSVTNCHLVQKLPDDLGRLRSLTVLRLSACPSLSMLPPSVSELQQLEFLDISLCRSLKDLPMEFDQLSNLKMLDMRECSGLKKLPKALANLKSLRRVICDESAGRQWLAIRASTMPNLKVEVVEERFSLDWLDE